MEHSTKKVIKSIICWMEFLQDESVFILECFIKKKKNSKKQTQKQNTLPFIQDLKKKFNF